MTEPAMLPKSSRRFSRSVVVVNCIVAWAAIFAAIFAGHGVATTVVPAAMTLIAWLVAGYMGVGALDFRTATAARRRPGDAP
jgi:hypothetical protein